MHGSINLNPNDQRVKVGNNHVHYGSCLFRFSAGLNS
jgi:hypothetical protein